MLCASDYRIDKGDKVTVIISKNRLDVFALSEQHMKDAVLTYGVLMVLFALCSIGMTTIFLLALFDK